MRLDTEWSTGPSYGPSTCPPPGFDAVADFDISTYIQAPWYVQMQVGDSGTADGFSGRPASACAAAAPASPLRTRTLSSARAGTSPGAETRV